MCRLAKRMQPRGLNVPLLNPILLGVRWNGGRLPFSIVSCQDLLCPAKAEPALSNLFQTSTSDKVKKPSCLLVKADIGWYMKTKRSPFSSANTFQKKKSSDFFFLRMLLSSCLGLVSWYRIPPILKTVDRIGHQSDDRVIGNTLKRNWKELLLEAYRF